MVDLFFLGAIFYFNGILLCRLTQIQTENQLADILTKGLGKNIFTKLRNEIHHVKDD